MNDERQALLHGPLTPKVMVHTDRLKEADPVRMLHFPLWFSVVACELFLCLFGLVFII